MANELTTLANVKQWLGIASTNDDALLTRMVTAYSNQVQTWLNRKIASQSYSETRDGHGGNRLVLADYPVIAVASVAIDGRAIPASSDYVTPGYRFTDQQIILQGYAFTRGYSNVALTYTAGYATTPPELEEAVIQIIAQRYKEKDRIGLKSKALAGESISFDVRAFSSTVQATLNNYRKVIPL